MKGIKALTRFKMSSPAWLEILKRSIKSYSAYNVPLISAGIAFYSLLSIFPGIAAAISIWGIFADPERISETIDRFNEILPEQALAIIQNQSRKLAESQTRTLGLGFLISTALALFGSSRIIKSFIVALNNIYREKEKRNFIIISILAFVMTSGLLLLLLIVVAAIIVSPGLLGWLGINESILPVYQILRWLFLIAFSTLAISILYRFGPSRRKAKWRWITFGSLLATFLWVIISAGFSFYVSNFSNYNETYGSLGAVVVLLMWLWLSAVIVLLGAIIDAEIELQTDKDTTIGPDKPMGERGAYVADNVIGKN